MKKAKKNAPDDYRALIFYRQSVVSRWLGERNSVIPCLRYRVPNKSDIEVNKKCDKAKYANLQMCKRLWLCPVCASRSAGRRRAQIGTAIHGMRQHGYALAFITYTVQHGAMDELVDIRHRVLLAHVNLHSGREWQAIEKEYDWAGSIKTCEITYGASGWHFHLHEIGFVADDSDMGELEARMGRRWRELVAVQGGYANTNNGLKIDRADSAVRDYVAKWGIVPELANTQAKQGRHGGIQPFQFPDLLMSDPDRASWAQNRFVEYSEAIHGVKQIWASPSIRPFMREPELLGEPGDRAVENLATLTLDQWRLVRRAGKRAELLRAAEHGELAAFWGAITSDN